MERLREYWFEIALLGVVLAQLLLALWHITDLFIAGHLHYNWGPAYWLNQALKINSLGLPATHWGMPQATFAPQLTALITALWTSAFGYAEYSMRALALVLTLITTAFVGLGFRRFLGEVRGLFAVALFAVMPIIFIYGKMIGPHTLVLLFAAIYVWGVSVTEERPATAQVACAISALGMVLSDWSGFWIALSLWVGTGFVIERTKTAAYRAALLSWIGAAIAFGCMGIVLQNYAQAQVPSGEFIARFYADFVHGITPEAVSWMGWVVRQLLYAHINFFFVVFVCGLVVTVLGVRERVRRLNRALWRGAVLYTFLSSGVLLYLVLGAHESATHSYYQHALALPIAFGSTVFVGLVLHRLSLPEKELVFLAAFGVLMGMGAFSVYEYSDLVAAHDGHTESDIAFLRTLRVIPQNSLAVVAASEKDALWYQNPNIEYYTGYPVSPYLVSEGFPPKDNIVVPQLYVQKFMDMINIEHGFGKGVEAHKRYCSTGLCLLQLTKPSI